MQTRDEIVSTMEVEQHIRKLETLVTLLVEYINQQHNNNDRLTAFDPGQPG